MLGPQLAYHCFPSFRRSLARATTKQSMRGLSPGAGRTQYFPYAWEVLFLTHLAVFARVATFTFHNFAHHSFSLKTGLEPLPPTFLLHIILVRHILFFLLLLQSADFPSFLTLDYFVLSISDYISIIT